MLASPPRVDQTVESGILHTVASEHGSLLLLAARFGAVRRRIAPQGLDDQVASASPVPTVLLGPADPPVQRAVLAISPADLGAVEPSLPIAIEMAARLRRSGLHLDVVVPERARGPHRSRRWRAATSTTPPTGSTGAAATRGRARW